VVILELLKPAASSLTATVFRLNTDHSLFLIFSYDIKQHMAYNMRIINIS
jgi:hypothetical protein